LIAKEVMENFGIKIITVSLKKPSIECKVSAVGYVIIY
jgi:hypothetical protein